MPLSANILVIHLAVIVALWLGSGPAFGEAAADRVERGAYLVRAGGCASCHTDNAAEAQPLAGGRKFETRFGVFYVPNITPDRETGIGGWSDEQFIRAMTEGVSPAGDHYYPLFPYRWYRRIVRDDLLAMKAYLDSLAPVRRRAPEHEIPFPLSIRSFVFFWKLMNMGDDDRERTPGLAGPAARGEYLVNALGHCGACHTKADYFQNYDDSQHLAGNTNLPGAYPASNLTPDPRTGLRGWSDLDLERVLAMGMRPDGTPVRGSMAEYVRHGTSQLAPADRSAIIAYIRAVPSIDHRIDRGLQPLDAPIRHDEPFPGGVPLDADLALGRAVAFGVGATGPEQACFRCHQAEKAGQSGGGFPLLEGQGAEYLEAQLRAYQAGRRASPVMEPIARALSEPQRKAVAAYYGSQAPPLAPLARPPVRAGRGRTLAISGDVEAGIPACLSCHGAQGIGVPPAYPYLAGQDPLYAMTQFSLWRSGHRRDEPFNVMAEVAARMSPADVHAVAEYFGSLRGR